MDAEDLKKLGAAYRANRHEMWDLGTRIHDAILSEDLKALSDQEVADLIGWLPTTVAKIRAEENESAAEARAAQQARMLTSVPGGGIQYADLVQDLVREFGIVPSTARRWIKDREIEGKLTMTKRGKKVYVFRGLDLGL